jgi:hypothetical protein
VPHWIAQHKQYGDSLQLRIDEAGGLSSDVREAYLEAKFHIQQTANTIRQLVKYSTPKCVGDSVYIIISAYEAARSNTISECNKLAATCAHLRRFNNCGSIQFEELHEFLGSLH